MRLFLAALLIGATFHLHAQSSAERVESAYWESIRPSTDPGDFRAYLEQFPNGKYVREARERLAALEAAASVETNRAYDPMPRAGDEWTYRLTQGSKARNYFVKVIAAKDLAITEQFAIEGGASGEWTHKGERQVVPLGLSLFSPYLLAYGPPSAFGRRVPVIEPGCSGNYLCEASASITRNETLRVPAGTFDCIRVEVEHSWRPAAISGQFGAQLTGSRVVTIWYAYPTKRAVKFRSRLSFGAYPPIETDFDLELVSYRLQ